MKRHTAILAHEELTFDTLPSRIQKKILKYNSIETSNSIVYKHHSGVTTKRYAEELTDLDDDICDLLYDHISDINDQKQQEAAPVTPEFIPEIPQKDKTFFQWLFD